MPEFVRDVEEIRQRAIRNIEEGAVTNAYQLDKDRSIAILNEALATEIVCVLRYMHHYFMATGVHGRAVAGEFKGHADAEREHADELAERIQQLGGKPDLNPGTLVQRSVAQYIEGESLADMIREDLIAERMVIEVYSEIIRYFGEKDPTTRVLIEHILSEEEEHANDLADMLYVVDPHTGEDRGIDPGTNALDIEGNRRRDQRAQRAGQQRRPQPAASINQPQPGERLNLREVGGPARGGRIEGFAQRGTGVPQDAVPNEIGADFKEGQREARLSRVTGRQRPDASTTEPGRQPGASGRPIRQRPQQTVEADVDTENDEGQAGGSRAVRISQPNRKKRIA